MDENVELLDILLYHVNPKDIWTLNNEDFDEYMNTVSNCFHTKYGVWLSDV